MQSRQPDSICRFIIHFLQVTAGFCMEKMQGLQPSPISTACLWCSSVGVISTALKMAIILIYGFPSFPPWRAAQSPEDHMTSVCCFCSWDQREALSPVGGGNYHIIPPQMLPLIRSINIPKTRVRILWGSLQCAGPLWQTSKLYSDLDMRQNWINQKKNLILWTWKQMVQMVICVTYLKSDYSDVLVVHCYSTQTEFLFFQFVPLFLC